MTADLAHQIGLVLAYASIAALVGGFGYALLEGVREGRAWRRTDRAVRRIARQRALGAHERITGDVIAERRR